VKFCIKRFCFILFFLCLYFSPAISFAGQSELESIIQTYQNKNVTIGVSVHEIKDQKELYSHNSHKPLNPASTMKVLTSVVALNHLGGAYQFKTPMSTDSFSNGTIQNLYIKGYGDPSLVEERLWRMVKDLKVRGVKKISGDIVIDNSYFDGFDFNGKEDGSSRAYNASLSALAVNFNSFAVVARNYGNGAVQTHVDPPIPYFVLSSSIKGSGNALTVSRNFQNGKEYVKAMGGVTGEKIKYANVSNPVQYAGSTLQWILDQNGIEFNGKIRAGTAVGAKKIVTDKSKPLSLILRDLNKFSNNFTAEMLVKTLGAKNVGVPGSTAKGVTILKDYLTNLGVSAEEYSVHNGSGLSRNNRLSPNTLNQILMSAYKNNKIRSDFMASLAIAGTDGTLHARLKAPYIAGNVKAKTGTLNDVSSLSGYLESKSKKMLAFTIMVNGAGAASGQFYKMQEKLLQDIYQSY